MAKFRVTINQWAGDGPQLPGVVCGCCGKPRTVVALHAPQETVLCKGCLTDAIQAIDEELRRSYRSYGCEDDGYPD